MAEMKRQSGNEAYRGYLICVHPLSGEIWVERDRHLICRPASVAAAKLAIDELTDWAPGPSCTA